MRVGYYMEKTGNPCYVYEGVMSMRVETTEW